MTQLFKFLTKPLRYLITNLYFKKTLLFNLIKYYTFPKVKYDNAIQIFIN